MNAFRYIVIALMIFSCGVTYLYREIRPLDATMASSNQLEIFPRNKYLGNVNQGATSAFELTIVNAVAEAVYLEDAHPSCGCTHLNFTKEKLDVNQATKLSGFLDASGRQGTFGSIITLTGRSANGRTFTGQAIISATAVTTNLIVPAALDFGSVILGGPKLFREVIIEKGGDNLKWDGIKVVESTFPYTIQSLANQRFKVSVYIDPRAINQIGVFKGEITLQNYNKTLQLDVPITRIPITGTFSEPGVDVVPPSIYVGVVSANKIISGSVKIKVSLPLNYHGLECVQNHADGGSSMFSKIVFGKDGSSLVIGYTISFADVGIISKKLILKVQNDDKSWQINIPIIGVVR
jgi:Protein of unknown function (DUF1573)